MAKREISTTLRNLKARLRNQPIVCSLLTPPPIKKKKKNLRFSFSFLLQFMQRAALKQESKPKDEEEEGELMETKVEDSIGVSPAPVKRCVVIMEGNPRPGALKGRMSFQSFNPSIDKLHEETEIVRKMQESNINHCNGTSGREDGISTVRSDSNSSSPNNNSDVDHKRKQPELNIETPSPNKSPKTECGDGSEQPSSSRKDSRGKQRRERLDWNLLRPPKSQPKRS